MTGSRRGSLIGATWLIGLGLVFLTRELQGWSWSQAWPLFVILVGVATFVSTALSWRPSVAGIWDFTWPIAWIAVGAILLLSTTGQLAEGPWEWLDAYWPWLAIGLGIWFLIGSVVTVGARPHETLQIPLDGVSQAAVRLQFGAGTLRMGRAPAGLLIDGTFPGGATRTTSGPGQVELAQDTTYGLPWLDHDATWTVGVTGEVPLDLRLDTGATKTVLDLRDTLLRRLELHTGASDTRVILPAAAGATAVKAEAGAASLVIEVPSGVAARIRTSMAVGSSQVDTVRFPRSLDGYESPDYATATNRVEIDVSGGVGSTKIVGAA
jgi:hypothetical protein